MTPHSPGTDQIDTLLWIGFVAATVLIVAINGALVYALRRYRGEPSPLVRSAVENALSRHDPGPYLDGTGTIDEAGTDRPLGGGS